MSVPTSSPSTPAPVSCQASISVSLPTYDWNAADQMHEFRLFKCQLDNWFWLHKVKAEECLDYLLCILGKEGYTAMDHTVLTGEADKCDPEKFLNYLESTLDDEISPQVQVYELEDIKKRSDESIDELIDRICQLTCHGQIGNSSDAAIEFRVQCRLIWAIPDANTELWKELLKVSHEKKVLHLLQISHTYYAVESGPAVMCASKAIHALCQCCQAQRNKPQKSASQCPNCTYSHFPGHDNCNVQNAICKGLLYKGHWHAKCQRFGTTSQQPTKSDWTEKAHHHRCCGKGKKADTVQVNTEETPPCDELFIDVIDCGTLGDIHPEKIVVDNVCAPQCNDAYTMVWLPASASSKGTSSLHIKVDTGAGGNVLPLCVFQHLYPNWISPDGLPTGLDHVSTRLTAYNGSCIPLFGTLSGPIIWQPGGHCTQPQKVNSYWYVADTPSPAILGLPSCKRLAVVKMKCTITVIQPNTKPPSPVPAPTATTVKPATTCTAAKSTKSTDDVIKEFSDQFAWIGRFPSEYTIWLHYDAHPVIHVPRKCPISLYPKVKEHLNKMECMGVITHVDQPMDWVSSITYVQKANGILHLCLDPHDCKKAIHHDHHKMPTVEEVDHEFVHSHHFTKLDAHHR